MSTAPAGPTTNATGQIASAFGTPTVLLPIAPGTDRVMVDDPHGLTLEQTQSPQYLAVLERSSIAVLCGVQSGQLAGLLFTSEPARESFLTKNPRVRTALHTPIPGGVIYWLRISGKAYPKKLDLKHCTWLGQGEVALVFDRAANEPISMGNEAHGPLTIEFSALIWEPEDRKVILPELIAARFDGPFRLNAKQQKVVNESFWARLIAEEAHIYYSHTTRRFYNTRHVEWTEVAETEVHAAVIILLNHFSSYPDNTYLKDYTRSIRVKALIRTLKAVATCDPPTDQSLMGQFLTDNLENWPGANVTTREILACYLEYCARLGLSPIPEQVMLRQLPGLIRKLFGIAKCNCVPRNNKHHRGFKNLRLKLKEG